MSKMKSNRRHFKASGINYVFDIVRGNEVVFYSTHGVDKNGQDVTNIDEFGYIINGTQTLLNVKNPLTVFNKVKDYVLEYVFINRVSYFTFCGSNDRIRLYHLIARRMGQHGFDYLEHNGRFTIYRTV